MARSRTAGPVLALTLVVVACTGDGQSPEKAGTPAATEERIVEVDDPVDEQDVAPAALELVWAADELEVFSGPTRVDDETVVIQVTDGDRLFLVGVDVSSGEERWRQETSPGEVVTGISLSPRVIGDHPVYFRPNPVGNLFAHLVIADPVTGEDVTSSAPLLFGSYPSTCDDDHRAICLQARDSYESSYFWYRLELDGSGRLEPDDGRPDEARALGGGGLLDVRSGDTEFMAVVDDGEELWRREVGEVVGPGFSSDFGWGWSYDEPTDRYIGSLGAVSEYDPGGVNTSDLSATRVVAIDRATGETLWAEDGVDHLCSYALSVPSDETVAMRAQGEDGVSRLPVPVRCRFTGTISFDGGDPDAEPVREGVSAVLEGFDPASGATTWEVTPDDPGQLLRVGPGDDTPVIRAGATGVVLRVDGTDTVVDLTTGETRAVEAGESFWCAGAEPTFDYREPYYFDDEPLTERYGHAPYGACDAAGEPLDEAVAAPSAVPNGVGVRVGDLTVVATPDGLRAYRDPDSA